VRNKILTLLALVALAGCTDSSAPVEPAASNAPATASAPAEATAPAERTAPASRDVASAAATTSSTDRIELAQADDTDLAALGYREGTHFVRLSPVQPTSTGPEQVEVAEFFMYSCIHCYNFEPYVTQWLEQKADYVNFVRVPTVWNQVVRLHAQAFYAAEALGKGEQMHTPFFREMHVTNNYLQSEDAMADFFGRFDVSQEDFESAFNSFAVHTKLQRADELARRYGVDSTPTIVINGKYRTNASMAGGYPELLELINALAASERAGN
jgi:thiol:disulfide interchange protein DsbA